MLRNDTARLLWSVGARGAVGRPWLPPVGDQDAAWWAQFGGPAPLRTVAQGETATQEWAEPDAASRPPTGG
jgi:hypothetical protein